MNTTRFCFTNQFIRGLISLHFVAFGSVISIATSTQSQAQKNKTGIGIFAGTRTYGNGDSNPIPDNLAYRFNWVTKAGFEGNVSLGSITFGQRFWISENIYTGLHGGFAVVSTRGISYSPAAIFALGANPFCVWICLTPEVSSGFAVSTNPRGQRIVPLANYGLGLTLWW